MNEIDAYKQFILQHHGPQALERLNAELAIINTNDVLSSASLDEFERKRKEYAIMYGHNKDTKPNDKEA